MELVFPTKSRLFGSVKVLAQTQFGETGVSDVSGAKAALTFLHRVAVAVLRGRNRWKHSKAETHV